MLYYYFSPSIAGWPEEAVYEGEIESEDGGDEGGDEGGEDGDNEQEEISETVDYSEALEVFADTFYSIATDLCPVDTGHLRSTIGFNFTGDGVECYVDCEYAEYVEYGTEYMGAQPYFRPALYQAYVDGIQAASQAYDEAYRMCEAIAGNIQSAGEAFGASLGFGPIGSLLMGALALLVSFPLMVVLYGLAETFSEAFEGGNYSLDNYKTAIDEAIEIISS